MKDSATQPKRVEPKVYKSEEELFAHKREQKKRTLAGIDTKHLETIPLQRQQ